MSYHHIARRVSIHLAVSVAMSTVANALLKWDLAKNISVTTQRARKS